MFLSEKNCKKLLRKLTGPNYSVFEQNKALFLIGEYDRLSNYAKAIAKLDENKLLYKIIRDAVHTINHEQAEMINKEIMNFLE